MSELMARLVRCEGDHRHVSISGVLPGAVTWDEYLDAGGPAWRPRFEAVRHCLVRDDRLASTGDRMAHGFCFVFDEEDMRLRFSVRAWGDLLQAIAGRREGYLAYCVDPRCLVPAGPAGPP